MGASLDMIVVSVLLSGNVLASVDMSVGFGTEKNTAGYTKDNC